MPSPERLIPAILRSSRASNLLPRHARTSAFFFASFASSFSPLLAEHTRNWRQSTYDDFLKGTSNGVAVRSDGRLELSPKFTLLADADASYLWSLRVDPKGILYAAGGSPAKVFRFDANGKPTIAFESTDLAAQAIAFDAKGTLYVGHLSRRKGLSRLAVRRKIRLLRSQNKIHLGSRVRLRRHSLRRHRRQRPGLCRFARR